MIKSSTRKFDDFFWNSPVFRLVKHPLFEHERARIRIDSISRLAVCISILPQNSQRSAEFRFRTMASAMIRKGARKNRWSAKRPPLFGPAKQFQIWTARATLRRRRPPRSVPTLHRSMTVCPLFTLPSIHFVVTYGFVASVLSANPVNSGGTKPHKTEFFISIYYIIIIIILLCSCTAVPLYHHNPSRRSVLILHPYGSIIILMFYKL